MAAKRIKSEPEPIDDYCCLMSFKPALSESEEEDTGAEFEDEYIKVENIKKEDIKAEFKEKENDGESDGEVDVDLYLIKALESKILIRKPTRPLSEYVSPNRSPKRGKSPPNPPLPASDLRWLIIREKQKAQEAKIVEQMRGARKKLYERELVEKEKQKKKQKKSKKSIQLPKANPEMIGLCGCRGRCEFLNGICLNLFKGGDNSDPNSEGDNHNNTI